ncbi:MAG: hypothetical protein ACLFV4_02835 [Candidatus Hydrogenedentota bacterium]
MIPLPLTTALAVYSLLIALGAMVIWIYTETTSQRYRRDLGRQHLWKCLYCGYTYLDENAERMSNCPRCESINVLDENQPAAAMHPAAHHEPSSQPEQPAETRRNTSKRKRPNQRKRGPRRRG